MSLARWQRLLPGLWAGWLLCVALLATPAPFALLVREEAGRVAGRMLAQEAYTSLVIGIVILVLERVAARRRVAAGQGSQFSLGMAIALLALFCTVAGYFALQPMMAAARSGQGPLSFGQLHAVSAAFYGVKVLAVLVLAWRAASPPAKAAAEAWTGPKYLPPARTAREQSAREPGVGASASVGGSVGAGAGAQGSEPAAAAHGQRPAAAGPAAASPPASS